MNIAQPGTVYTLDGTDDRCGAAQGASARGMAFVNARYVPFSVGSKMAAS